MKYKYQCNHSFVSKKEKTYKQGRSISEEKYLSLMDEEKSNFSPVAINKKARVKNLG